MLILGYQNKIWNSNIIEKARKNDLIIFIGTFLKNIWITLPIKQEQKYLLLNLENINIMSLGKIILEWIMNKILITILNWN